jgi:hypothetical protein
MTRNCYTNAFSCLDDTCIPKRLVSDKYVDCSFGEDKQACDSTYNTCEDLWNDGFSKSNIYTVGGNHYVVKILILENCIRGEKICIATIYIFINLVYLYRHTYFLNHK